MEQDNLQELYEMRQQVDLLKAKLDKEKIVNQKMIDQAMRSNISSLNRQAITLMIVGLINCPVIYFLLTYYGFSLGCAIYIIVLQLISCVATALIHWKLFYLDPIRENMAKTAETVTRLRRAYEVWPRFGIPMCMIWLIWIGYEAFFISTVSDLAQTMAIGAIVGGLMGGAVGLKMNRKAIRKSDEILAQIEDLQSPER